MIMPIHVGMALGPRLASICAKANAGPNLDSPAGRGIEERLLLCMREIQNLRAGRSLGGSMGVPGILRTTTAHALQLALDESSALGHQYDHRKTLMALLNAESLRKLVRDLKEWDVSRVCPTTRVVDRCNGIVCFQDDSTLYVATVDLLVRDFDESPNDDCIGRADLNC